MAKKKKSIAEKVRQRIGYVTFKERESLVRFVQRIVREEITKFDYNQYRE